MVSKGERDVFCRSGRTFFSHCRIVFFFFLAFVFPLKVYSLFYGKRRTIYFSGGKFRFRFENRFFFFVKFRITAHRCWQPRYFIKLVTKIFLVIVLLILVENRNFLYSTNADLPLQNGLEFQEALYTDYQKTTVNLLHNIFRGLLELIDFTLILSIFDFLCCWVIFEISKKIWIGSFFFSGFGFFVW